jgi:hypothetical protein
VLPGVNTLPLTSTSAPGPDIVALGATVTNNGIANIPPGMLGTGFFSVATVNVGAGAQITACSASHPAHQLEALTDREIEEPIRGTRTAWRISTSAPVRGCV